MLHDHSFKLQGKLRLGILLYVGSVLVNIIISSTAASLHQYTREGDAEELKKKACGHCLARSSIIFIYM